MEKDTMYARIEAERKALGIKQVPFVNEYLGGISTRTYQHKKSECITPAIALKLCKLFNCSLDYLYGIDDCKQRAVNDVHEVTGLSEEAILLLRKWNKQGDYNDPILSEYVRFIDHFITQYDFDLSTGYFWNASHINYVKNLDEYDKIKKLVDRRDLRVMVDGSLYTIRNEDIIKHLGLCTDFDYWALKTKESDFERVSFHLSQLFVQFLREHESKVSPYVHKSEMQIAHDIEEQEAEYNQNLTTEERKQIQHEYDLALMGVIADLFGGEGNEK